MKAVRGFRGLLNQPGHQTSAAIVAEIEDTRLWPKGHYITENGEVKELSSTYQADPEIVLHFSDCDRSISFWFSFSNEAERDNNLFKVDTLYDAIKEFRKAMHDEHRRYVQRVKNLKADD